MSNQKIFLCFFLLLSISVFCDDTLKKINNANLLFPYLYENTDDRKIEYKLTAFNGCYEWFSTNNNYISAQDIPDENQSICSSNVIVSLVSNKYFSNTIWIIAKDKETGDKLKAEAKISFISKIEILTKSKIIEVGQIQLLEILGFDKDDNVFSTLEGVKFEWNLEKCENKLEIISLKDSLIKTSEIRKNLNRNFYQTDIVVIKGISKGSCIIEARLNEKGYMNELFKRVTINIIEHFTIFPDYDLYILPLSNINYELFLINNENSKTSYKKIILPSTNYEWNLDNNLADIKNNGKLIAKSELGEVKLSVQDKDLENNKIETHIYIVEATKLDLNIKECEENEDLFGRKENIFFKDSENPIIFDNIWNLIENKLYYIRANLFDRKNNQIRFTDNIKIDFDFNPNYITIIKQNNNELIIKPIRKIEKVLTKAVLSSNSKINCEKYIGIYSQIKIIKPTEYIHLPYTDNSLDLSAFIKLHVLGGSNRYEWVSHDSNIGLVSQEGVIKSKNEGSTKIEVRDKLNIKNYEILELKVSKVNNVHSLEEYKEFLVNEPDHMFIIAEGGVSSSRYSNCTNLNFYIEPKYEKILDSQPSYSDYFSLISDISILRLQYPFFKELLPESKLLTITTYSKYIDSNEITLKDLEKILLTYKNYGICSKTLVSPLFSGDLSARILRIDQISVKSNALQIKIYDHFRLFKPMFKVNLLPEIILAFGSSFEWVLEGGPRIWEESRELYNNYEILKENQPYLTQNNVIIKDLSKKIGLLTKRVYNTECSINNKISNTFDIKIYSCNKADKKLPRPLNITFSIKVSCKIPSKLQIYTWHTNEESFDIFKNNVFGFEVATLKNIGEHYFQLFAFDDKLTPFYNFSSLNIEWGLTKSNKAYCKSIKSDDYINSYICPLCEDQYRSVVLSNCNEDLTLTANTNTYKSIFSSLTFPKLEDQITLNALLDIEVVPKRALYYLDKRNTGLLKVLHGSGIFNVKCNDTNIISFDFNRTEGTITITPLNKGFVRIIVEDLKLESSIPSYCDIIVMDVAKLKLTSNSNLIQINDATIFELTILDQNNEIFPQDQYKYMSISLVLDTDSEYLKNSALKITHLTNKEKYLFNVQGFISGYYKVVAILETNKINNNLDLYSNLVDLHVFSELKIYPTELLLAPGCSSTIEVIDGPSEKSKALNNIILEVNTPNNIVSFKNLESNLFEVFGLILGQSDIIFNLKQKDTNKIIGKSSIKVQVGLVNDIEILGMVDRILYIGSIVRLIGIIKLNKMPLSHCICKFDYLWKSKDENILSIASIVPETNVQGKYINLEENYMNIGANASALTEGLTEILLTVVTNYDHKYESASFTKSVRVKVIDPLNTDIPVNFNKEFAKPSLLLIPPHSNYRLKINKDISKLSFSHFTGQNENDVSIDDKGLIQTTNVKGKFTFLIEDHANDKEIMVINVLVTNIYSIIVEKSYKVFSIPPDAEVKLKIVSQDFFGRHFPREIETIKFTVLNTNQNSVSVKISEYDYYLIIRAKSIGSSILKVFLTDYPNIFDIFIVNVGTIIKPLSPVYVHEGGTIDFSITSRHHSIENIWTSENSNLIEIDKRNGKALAIKEGRVNIYYNDIIQYTTKVIIYKANKIIMNEFKSPNKITSIITHQKFQNEYIFYFRVISDDKEIKFLNNNNGENKNEIEINNNLKFECENDLPEVFLTKGDIIYDNVENQQTPICTVIFKKNSQSFQLKNQIKITTKIISTRINTEILIQDFNIEYIPSFKIKETYIELNPKNNEKTIKIYTIQDLDYKSDSDFLEKYTESHFDSVNKIYTLKISIPEKYKAKGLVKGNLEIFNYLTNQIETVIVVFDPFSNSEPLFETKNSSDVFSLADFLVVVFTTIVLIFGGYYYLKDKNTYSPR